MKIYFFNKIISTNKLTHSLTHTHCHGGNINKIFNTKTNCHIYYTISQTHTYSMYRKHITNIMSIELI